MQCCRLWPLQVESPSCLWGRVVRGPDRNAETTRQYDNLLTQMNLFYHDVTHDLHKLKPTPLEEGQVMQHLMMVCTPDPAAGCVLVTASLDCRRDGFVCVLSISVFPLRCVWCTGQWWSLGVELWWNRSLWTLLPVGLAASLSTMEYSSSSPQTSKTRRVPVFLNTRPVQFLSETVTWLEKHINVANRSPFKPKHAFTWTFSLSAHWSVKVQGQNTSCCKTSDEQHKSQWSSVSYAVIDMNFILITLYL